MKLWRKNQHNQNGELMETYVQIGETCFVRKVFKTKVMWFEVGMEGFVHVRTYPIKKRINVTVCYFEGNDQFASNEVVFLNLSEIADYFKLIRSRRSFNSINGILWIEAYYGNTVVAYVFKGGAMHKTRQSVNPLGEYVGSIYDRIINN